MSCHSWLAVNFSTSKFNWNLMLQHLYTGSVFFINYISFTLPCRGLGLVGLALDLMDWPTIVLQCFDTVGWVVWLCHVTIKIVHDMTYNVFGGTLNPTQSLEALFWYLLCAINNSLPIFQHKSNNTHHNNLNKSKNDANNSTQISQKSTNNWTFNMYKQHDEYAACSKCLFRKQSQQ